MLLILNGSFVSGNWTEGYSTYDGGILNGGTLTMENSTVSGNWTEGYSTYGGGTCNLTETTDLPDTNPLLGPLADNGGPTFTHALLAGSPAIDAIPLAYCNDADGNPLTTDQRGVARPQGAACDIGAYEFEPAVGTLSVGIDIKPGSYPNSINLGDQGLSQ